MKIKGNKSKMRSRYKILNTENTFFITSSVQNWIKIFESEIYINILIDAIKYNQKNKYLDIYSYVIMKDHFHMVCKSNQLSNIISSIKSYSAKKIIEQLKTDNEIELLNQFENNKLKGKTDRQYQIWQEGFHPEEIISEEMFNQKVEYIHYNPVKKEYVKDINNWKYSSFSDYEFGKIGLIELNLDIY
jgi:putative transposase